SDLFHKQATELHRVAQFIKVFKLNETELSFFINHSSDFDDINFKELSFTHWKRIRNYVLLRQNVPQVQSKLTDIFLEANNEEPDPLKIKELIHLATAWNLDDLSYIIDTVFELSFTNFQN